MPSEVVIPSTYNGKAVTTIDFCAFYDCKSITSLSIPNTITIIDSLAFYGCSSLNSIVIPDSVAYIGDYAFIYCSSLVSIEVHKNNQNYKSIDGNLYSEDGKILIQYAVGKEDTSFELPFSVVSISDYAFCGCTSLSDVVIENFVTSIGDLAFYSCTNLTSVSIGNSVTSIGVRAFDNCGSLTSIEVNAGNQYYQSINGSLYSKNGKILIQYATGKKDTLMVLPNITSIGNYAFYGCKNLVSLVIPASVTSIGELSLSDCTSLSSVYYIGTAEKWNDILVTPYNDSLKNATLYYYSETEPIEGGNFWHWVDGVPTVWDNGSKLTPTPDEYFEFTLLDNGTYSIKAKDVNNMPSEVVIPSTYNGKAVTAVGEFAFYNCTSVTSIVIPDSVTTISTFAFGNCTALANLVIPDSVEFIGEFVFLYCSSLANIEVDENNQNYKSIDGSLYSKDGKILIQYAVGKADTSFEVPEGVTTINSYAFFSCATLTNVVLPDSLTTINDWAFHGITSLTSVAISKGVTSIGEGAFLFCPILSSIEVDENNRNFKSIDGILYSEDGKTLIMYPAGKTDETFVIPDDVTTIGAFAFHSSTPLKSVVIPVSVTTFGDGAFMYCSSLTDIYYTGSENEWPKLFPNYFPTNITIHYNYVPEE